MKLYEFAPAFAELLDLVEDDGEVTPEWLSKIGQLELEFADKVDNMCRLIRSILAEAEARRYEADRLYALACRGDRQAETIKSYLMFEMGRLNCHKLRTEIFNVRVQSNSKPSVSFDGDVDEIPAEYVKITKELNKSAIVEAARDGKELPPGVSLSVGSHLRIS